MEKVESPSSRRLFGRLLPILYEWLYHQFAFTYDRVAWLVSAGSWQTWVHAVTKYLVDGDILEIGFGPGHLLESLCKKKIVSFGLDESPQMLRIAKRRLVMHGYRPNLIRGVAQTLPFANQSISQVVMTFPSEFAFRSDTLSEIHRVLIPRGSVIILPMAWITGRKIWERLAAQFNHTTGEAISWNPKILEPMKEAGFTLGWEMIDFPNSRVVIVTLEK